jgi:hypothetical protein
MAKEEKKEVKVEKKEAAENVINKTGRIKTEEK